MQMSTMSFVSHAKVMSLNHRRYNRVHIKLCLNCGNELDGMTGMVIDICHSLLILFFQTI